MRNTILVHLVWTTRSRAPTIDLPRANLLAGVLRGIARRCDCLVLGIGMVSTHLHTVVRVAPVTPISRLAQRLKGASARIVNRDLPSELPPLRWARGFTARPVPDDRLEAALAYLRAQPRRHPQDAIEGWLDR